MLGYDVKYAKNADDDAIISVAVDEGRVVLTADDLLHRIALSRGARSLLVKGLSDADQLASVAAEFGISLDLDTESSRCPVCNFPIEWIEGDDVKRIVPTSTLKLQKDFWVCMGCGKVYWRGSHHKRINATIAKARQLLLKK